MNLKNYYFGVVDLLHDEHHFFSKSCCLLKVHLYNGNIIDIHNVIFYKFIDDRLQLIVLNKNCNEQVCKLPFSLVNDIDSIELCYELHINNSLFKDYQKK